MARRSARGGGQRKRGRPSKLTDEVTDAIVQAVRAGNYLDTAADHAGVDRSTVYRWIKAGEDADAPAEVRDFCAALSRARAEAEARMVAAVMRDAIGGVVIERRTRRYGDITEVEERLTPPNGRVALEYLARSRPSTWTRRTDVALTGADGGPVQVEQRSVVIGVLADRLHSHLTAGELLPAGGDGEDEAGDGDPLAS
jgi:hypothetical protein